MVDIMEHMYRHLRTVMSYHPHVQSIHCPLHSISGILYWSRKVIRILLSSHNRIPTK